MTIAPEWLLRVATDAVLRRWLDVMSYQIRVESGLDQHWASWFEGIQITQEPGGVTLIAADVADQAALHGLLAKVRDLGLPLISVQRTDPGTPRRSSDASRKGPDTPAPSEG